MAGLGSWFQSISGPIARQVLVSLGVGVTTFVGLDAAVQSALSAAKSALGGLTGDITQILALGGGFAALSTLAGGILAGVTMIALSRFTKI